MDDRMGDFLKLSGGVLDTGELWGRQDSGKVGWMSTKPTHKHPKTILPISPAAPKSIN